MYTSLRFNWYPVSIFKQLFYTTASRGFTSVNDRVCPAAAAGADKATGLPVTTVGAATKAVNIGWSVHTITLIYHTQVSVAVKYWRWYNHSQYSQQNTASTCGPHIFLTCSVRIKQVAKP